MGYSILITNDDGVDSLGILELKKALSPLGKVIIVAPSSEKSACSHSVTLDRPLKIVEVEKDTYKIDGTPSDCIYISKYVLFHDKSPDIVVSGINRGANLGEDTIYSGTVAGAMEASFQGIPAIAISQVLGERRENIDYSVAGRVAFNIVKKILENRYPLSSREILNINVPPNGNPEKMEITYLGYRRYRNNTHLYTSPFGEKLYWLGYHSLEWDSREVGQEFRDYRSDFEAVADEVVSITPIKADWTSYRRLRDIELFIK
ncbi:MAG TPA: 5'/3'-nucleotidase SurE [Campylobacterales bacterium]|nr:5'/3'-nucleotidase SurE [Campylobacterales bacterium]